MQVQTTIQKWGNSLALRLTGPLKSIPHFKENMLVNVEISHSSICISPAKPKREKLLFKEKDLLKGLTKKTSHADEVALIRSTELKE